MKYFYLNQIVWSILIMIESSYYNCKIWFPFFASCTSLVKIKNSLLFLLGVTNANTLLFRFTLFCIDRKGGWYINECLQVYTLDLFRISNKNEFHLSYGKCYRYFESLRCIKFWINEIYVPSRLSRLYHIKVYKNVINHIVRHTCY